MGDIEIYSNEDFLEVRTEYFKAIENNDYEKQQVLLELGDKYLDKEMGKIQNIVPFNSSVDKIYNDHFNSVLWQWRLQKDLLGDGVDRFGYNISIYPKRIVYGQWDTNASWNALVSKHAGQHQWGYKNMDSMKKQYVCHVNIAANAKTPWNLEVDRPYSTVNPFTCN